MLHFDEQTLLTDLWRLFPWCRVIFSAACAQRQMPAYRLLLGNHAEHSNPIVMALDDVWTNPVASDQLELQQQLKACVDSIPSERVVEPWTELATYAQNAAMSVVYTLRARVTGEAQEAVWSARVTYDSLDQFVINRRGIDTNLPTGEAQVLSDALVQAELLRQQRDLNELLATNENNLENVVAVFQSRANAESSLFFGKQSHFSS